MQATRETIFELLRNVMDPEIPVVDVVGMGIVRDAALVDGELTVTITPTYSGCPAMAVIAEDIEAALHAAGYPRVRVKTVHAPPWTTDWMTPQTRERLKAEGIAPPAVTCAAASGPAACPYCSATDTSLRSWFGSTACKALYYCNQCHQPFEEFKCI